MRLIVTADLHYDAPRSRTPAEALARDICRAGGDALVLVGDSAGAAHQDLRDCLRLFAAFGGKKFLVPGNHCLWCLNGEDSITRYEQTLPAIAAEADFAVLDHAPARLGGVGLVGSIGWYDYSYRYEELDLPLAFYRAKITPGAARRFDEHRHLVAAHRRRLSKRHFDLTARWMDGVHVRMDLTDEEFLDRLLGKLVRQLGVLAGDPAVERIVAFVHHLPFRQLVPQGRPAPFAFSAAFMGSDRIGRALLDCPLVTHVYCGHSHWAHSERIEHMQVVNIGSTYVEKRMEILDL